MYFASVKTFIFPLVCALSLFLNIFLLSNWNSFGLNIIKKFSTTYVKDDSNSTKAITTIDRVTNTNVTLDTNKIISEFLLLPSISCNNSDVPLVICVPSSRDNFDVRKIIRKTWGSYANSSSNEAILLFFVGLEKKYSDPFTRSTQQLLELESKFFGDIVQGDYIDSYRNLTLKSLSMLSWVTKLCPKSQFILKADDDMYINVPLLVQTLKNASNETSSFIIGVAQRDGHPHRDTTSKWFVDNNEYKDEMYPHFVLGPSYAMTTSAAKRLYKASRYVPFFFLEDVYITGLCARKAQVPVLHSDLFSNFKQPVKDCYFRHHISAHGYSSEEIVQIHKHLFDSSRAC